MATTESINRIIGDAGFIAEYGREPDHDHESARIRAHFDMVIATLRAANVDHLTPAARVHRAHCLNLLETYRDDGIVPRNSYTPDRNPVFIDADNRLCAVGFLIAVTEGYAAAANINEHHQLSYIQDIDAPELDKWAQTYGFTRHELAMIQPSYPGEYHAIPSVIASPDFVLAWGIFPAFALLFAWLVRRESRWCDVAMTVAGAWGLFMLMGNLANMLLRGRLSLSTDHLTLMVGSTAIGAILLGIRLFWSRISVAHRRPVRGGVAAFFAAASVLLAVSLVPWNETTCGPNDSVITYKTEYGYWRAMVTPALVSPNFISRRSDLRYQPGLSDTRTKIGNVVACPAWVDPEKQMFRDVVF